CTTCGKADRSHPPWEQATKESHSALYFLSLPSCKITNFKPGFYVFTLHGYSSKLLVLLGLCLLIGSIFSMATIFIAPLLFPIDHVSDVLNNVNDPANLQALKFLQLFNALGIFVVPPLVYVWLFSEKPLETLSLNIVSKPILYGLT